MRRIFKRIAALTRHLSKVRWWQGFALLSSVSGLSFAAGPDAGACTPGVRLSVPQAPGGTMRLEVVDIPLGEVLDEIGSKTGVRVHHAASDADRVDMVCSGTDAGALVQCLIGSDGNLIIRRASGSTAGSGRVEELWVLPTRSGGGPLAQRTGSGPPCRIPQVESSMAKTPTTTSGGTAGSNAPDETAKAVGLATAGDSERRVQGLSRLGAEGYADDARVQEILEDAFAAEDASVRAQAVAAFARHGGDRAASVLRQALHDSDPSVRLMAVSNAGSDGQGVVLLQEALKDSDPTVKALAAMKLAPRNE